MSTTLTVVRDFGTDAFAREISSALPLSRFLVEASSEGCDLSSAEGRAHMLANARPLWAGLPDGALKRQLLVELAELGQLPSADLSQLVGAGRSSRPCEVVAAVVRAAAAPGHPAPATASMTARTDIPNELASWSARASPRTRRAATSPQGGYPSSFQKKPWTPGSGSNGKGPWKNAGARTPTRLRNPPCRATL